jgi:hypothetical protein
VASSEVSTADDDHERRSCNMYYAGLDLSRKRLDVHVLDEAGETVEVRAIGPDADGLRSLATTLGFSPVQAAVESMNGARFVHDQLESHGWDVELADAIKVKGLAPLACKTDKIDAWVLAELCRRDLVPAIWLPTPEVRAERERARFRQHLVRHRVSLKNRIHATLTAFGHPCPVSDLFGSSGRELLGRLELPKRGPLRYELASRSSIISTTRSTPATPNCVAWEPITSTSRCFARSRASPGSLPTRSLRRSVTSLVSHPRRSSSATRGCVLACTSRARATGAGRSHETGPVTFAGP